MLCLFLKDLSVFLKDLSLCISEKKTMPVTANVALGVDDINDPEI